MKKANIDLYNNNGYAYIVCDPERRGKELSKAIYYSNDNIDSKFENCGIFVLVSNLDFDIKEILPMYYMRQSVERMFSIAKNDLNPNFYYFTLYKFTFSPSILAFSP